MFPNSNWNYNPDDLWFLLLEKWRKGPRFDGENLYQLEFPKHFMEDDYFKRFQTMPGVLMKCILYIKIKRQYVVWHSNFGLCRYDGYTLSWMYEDHLTNVPNGGSFLASTPS